ncbi:hypothetical protein ACB094_11G141200 [Castanea mollissima]
MSIFAANSTVAAAAGLLSPPSLTMELSPKNQSISPCQPDSTDNTVIAYWTMIVCVLVVVAYALGFWSKRQIMSLRQPRPPPPPSSDAAPPPPSSDAAPPPAPPAPRRERGLVCNCRCAYV